MQLNIAYLYPDLLNIYGDRGNIICLKYRLEKRGIKVKVVNISLNDNFKTKNFDLFFGGGGQDRQQLMVAKDLQKKKKVLKQEADRGVPMLTICGTYQLFGRYFRTSTVVEERKDGQKGRHFKTNTGKKIKGISIFDAYTIAGRKRKIGNVVVKINPLISQYLNISISSLLVGFENHSGNTYLQGVKRKPPTRWSNLDTSGARAKTYALGKVIKGFGNNGKDKTEGAVYKNVIGTYLHGPILPKNPHLADWLIQKALEIKYKKKIKLKPLDDNLEWQAHKTAVKRS